MRRALFAILTALVCTSALAVDVKTYIPKNAYSLMTVLCDTREAAWPDGDYCGLLAAQVERESCISLTHSRCWSPTAELKTKREYGFGLAQHTIAYRQDGSVRFNTQQELRQKYASLRDWTFEKRFDPKYQLLALVEMDHGIFRRISNAASERERLAFMLSAYNGGESGVRQDRLLCSNTGGCDPDVWFDNVERYSLKTRKVNPGYGQSAYDINRGYVKDIMFVRRPKYDLYFESEK